MKTAKHDNFPVYRQTHTSLRSPGHVKLNIAQDVQLQTRPGRVLVGGNSTEQKYSSQYETSLNRLEHPLCQLKSHRMTV